MSVQYVFTEVAKCRLWQKCNRNKIWWYCYCCNKIKVLYVGWSLPHPLLLSDNPSCFLPTVFFKYPADQQLKSSWTPGSLYSCCPADLQLTLQLTSIWRPVVLELTCSWSPPNLLYSTADLQLIYIWSSDGTLLISRWPLAGPHMISSWLTAGSHLSYCISDLQLTITLSPADL